MTSGLGAMRAGALLLALCWAPAARAVDGVIEISQVGVLRDGGYPFAASAPGSYRLTSNLDVSTPDTSAIMVGAPAVTIDLNGYTIRGPLTYNPGTSMCSAPSAAAGIAGSTSGVVVLNGQVTGFANGISLTGAGNRVERVIAEGNCAHAIDLGQSSLIIDCIARRNGGASYRIASGGRLSGSLAEANGLGVYTNLSIVESSTVSDSANTGITGGVGALVRNNRVTSNDFNGIVVGIGALVLDNIVTDHPGTAIFGATQTEAQVGTGGNVVTYDPGSTGYFYLTHLYCDFENTARLCLP